MSEKKLKITRSVTGDFNKVVNDGVKIMSKKRFEKDE